MDGIKVPDGLSGRSWDVLERCVLAYEEDRKRGLARPLDGYLPAVEDPLRRPVLIELVKVDLDLEYQAGNRPCLEEYCSRYPELGLGDTLPADLIYESYRLGRRFGSDLELDDYCQKFPNHRDELLHLARRDEWQTTVTLRRQPLREIDIGVHVDDFEIMELVGEGAFAKVYLARQVSLNRQVALKVSAIVGAEARTLASLEHDHIVQVFSESIHADQNVRLLCMQFVPGTTLADVVLYLAGRPDVPRNGAGIVQAIDALNTRPVPFHPGALRDREQLAGANLVEAVCFIGRRLADALAYAHTRGILHRDIKPANILVNPYGRPLLADFNLSLDPHQVAGTTGSVFGGSLGYMSPEHLDAFNPLESTPPEAVDERSDLYSLGVVLFELATGLRPFNQLPKGVGTKNPLRKMAEIRRAGPPELPEKRGLQFGPLNRVVRRCLEPDPASRFQSSAELSEALESAAEIERVQSELPSFGRATHFVVKRPFVALMVLAIVPHILGSIVNISYNTLRIVSELTVSQQKTFHSLVLGYNVIAYPLAVWAVYALAAPVFRTWRKHRRSRNVSPEEATDCRHRLVKFPLWVMALSCLGWFPGGVLFPLGLQLFAEPVSLSTFGHFVISFTMSGVIAMTYAYFGVEFIALRVLYPELLEHASSPRTVARQELRTVETRLRIFQALAGIIPLFGAVMMVGVGPEKFPDNYLTFRLLVTLLIALGMAGFGLAVLSSSVLMQTLNILTGRTR